MTDNNMRKMPPIEKIPEAWSAIADGRVTEQSPDRFTVTSSNGEKSYVVTLDGNRYRSNDSATKFARYPGYPVLAVMMIKGQLPLPSDLISLFKGINWNAINKQFKRDYRAALENALSMKKIEEPIIHKIYAAMDECFAKLANSDYHV